MMYIRKPFYVYLRYLTGILFFYTVNVAFADEPPVVVVNAETYPHVFLSQNTIYAIFGMRLRKWKDGSPIKVFVLPDEDPLHIAFSKNVLHVFPYQLRTAWDRRVFSGTGEEPIIVKSEQQMRTVIEKTFGAIGYLSRPMLNESIVAISAQ